MSSFEVYSVHRPATEPAAVWARFKWVLWAVTERIDGDLKRPHGCRDSFLLEIRHVIFENETLGARRDGRAMNLHKIWPLACVPVTNVMPPVEPRTRKLERS